MISYFNEYETKFVEIQRNVPEEQSKTNSTSGNIQIMGLYFRDLYSVNLHNANLLETVVSDWSVKSKCQSTLSSPHSSTVLACKTPCRGNKSQPSSFSHPAATSSPKLGKKCHIKPPCLWQSFVEWGLALFTHAQTHTHSPVASHKYPTRCNFPPTSHETLPFSRQPSCQPGAHAAAHQHPSAQQPVWQHTLFFT